MVLWVALLCLCFSVVQSSLTFPLRSRQTNTLTTSMGRKLGGTRASWRIPLQGNLTSWGEFFTVVGLGTPTQYVPVQVDTGSADLIVYAKSCSGCNSTATYSADASTTARTIMCDSGEYNCYDPDMDCDGLENCQWEDQFGDGSTIDGNVIEDLFTLAGKTTTYSISLGAIESVDAPNGFEAFGVDGIWGLAFSALSGWGGDPAIGIFIDDFNLYDSFSLCIANQPGGNGGTMEIGTNYAKDSKFVWTPIQEEQWYTVYMTNWYIGGTSLGVDPTDLNWDGVIVDSGTTLIIVPYWVMDPIKSYFEAMCNKTKLVGICGVPKGQTIFDNQCFPMTATEVAAYPPMTFAFTGINGLTIQNTDYLWQGAGIPGYYCMGIQQIDNLGIILGDVLIQRYHVVFDRYEDQVGFGPLSTCP